MKEDLNFESFVGKNKSNGEAKFTIGMRKVDSMFIKMIVKKLKRKPKAILSINA